MQSKLTSYRVLLYFLLGAYFLVLIKLLLFRTQLGGVHYHFIETTRKVTAWENFKIANFIPFRGMFKVLFSSETLEFKIQNIGGNIVGFMPLGILLPMLFPSLWSAKRIALFGFATSFTFELIQLLAVRGFFDVDDMILNTLGTLAGFGVLHVIIHLGVRREVLQAS